MAALHGVLQETTAKSATIGAICLAEPRMIQHSPGVTELLAPWRDGDERAGDAIFRQVYDELRTLADRYLGRELPGHTLQPTALVNEACLRLLKQDHPDVENRAHLIGVAANLMRQVLVNHALRRKTAKRGGDYRRIALDSAVALMEERCVDLIALNEALDRLACFEPRRCRIVEMRFFGGMTVTEIAATLGVPLRTIEREWSMAKAWLRQEILAA